MKKRLPDPDLILKLQRYTAPFDVTGHPTVTLPGGLSQHGLPIGMQLVGRDETLLIRAAVAFQHETPWHRRHPLPQS
jgi:amidase